jgi:hypothetical protein
MYVDFAVFGAGHGAEQAALTERAEQTTRMLESLRDGRQRRRAAREQRRDGRRRNAYTTAA